MSRAENGLFLVGDGAQTIYKRGFALRPLGIDISSRTFILGKNYRNTREILTAAFALVAEYEFADTDEEHIGKPTAPEFAQRHGARPMIVRCHSLAEEATMVARMVHSRIDAGVIPGQICIVGPSVKARDEIKRTLSELEVTHTDLRLDADYESEHVKVSTIESAKGHEFADVYIIGLVDGVLPKHGSNESELPREAARLYVAMTRAREVLTLSYSPSLAYPASPFLLAIQPHCDEARVKNGELHRLLPS